MWMPTNLEWISYPIQQEIELNIFSIPKCNLTSFIRASDASFYMQKLVTGKD